MISRQKKQMDGIRAARAKTTAEIFTPLKTVNEMLELLPMETWKENKTFLDPACGNGNILIEVLRCKLSLGHEPLNSLQTIYGADIMSDNIRECRFRLLNMISQKSEITEEMIRIVFSNVVCTNRLPKGSLDYDFSFPSSRAEKTIKEWIRNKALIKIEEGSSEDNFPNEEYYLHLHELQCLCERCHKVIHNLLPKPAITAEPPSDWAILANQLSNPEKADDGEEPDWAGVIEGMEYPNG